jgi:hypothetical protein
VGNLEIDAPVFDAIGIPVDEAARVEHLQFLWLR